MPTPTTNQIISALYVATFNRAPDKAGLTFWQGAFTQNTAAAASALAAGFASHPVFTQLYPTTMSNLAFVQAIYTNVLGAAGDAAGILFWNDALNAGLSRSNFLAAFVESALSADLPAALAAGKLTQAEYDAAVIRQEWLTNKADVGLQYANTLGAASNLSPTTDTSTVAGLNADPAYLASIAILSGVDNTNASEITALTTINAAAATSDPVAYINSQAPTGAVGETFTLTTAIDNIVGTNNNDTIIAGVTGAGDNTLTPGDSVNGGAGVDRLNLFGNANAANFATANITSVENVYAQLANGALDTSANADVKQAWVAGNSTGANAVTLTQAQTGGVQGTAGTTATFTFKNVAGAADAASVALDGAKLTTALDVDGIETLTVSATGANSVNNLSADSVTKLVVTGTGSVSAIAGGGGTFKTVDASGLAGGLTLDLSGVAPADHTITGGAGNDTVTLLWANQTAADVINLGAGSGDTLLFADATTITTAAQADQISKVTGVEELGTKGAVLTVDGDLVTQTHFSTSGGGSVALTDLAQGSIVEFGTGGVLGNTAALKLGASTLNIELHGSDTASAGAGLTVNGSSTLNVASTGTVGVADNVLIVTAADNQSIVLTGAQNTTLTASAATGVTGFSIDASAFTGKATITGTQASDIIKGGSGADTLSGGANLISDTFTGGAGADKFITLSGITAATADIITDFVSTSDTISFSSAAGTAANYSEGAAPVADFTAALAAANLVLTGAVPQYNVQQVGSDSWVFFNDGGAAGADQVIQLTGVALAGIQFSDIVI